MSDDHPNKDSRMPDHDEVSDITDEAARFFAEFVKVFAKHLGAGSTDRPPELVEKVVVTGVKMLGMGTFLKTAFDDMDTAMFLLAQAIEHGARSSKDQELSDILETIHDQPAHFWGPRAKGDN